MGAVIWMWRGAVQSGRGQGFDGVGFLVAGSDSVLLTNTIKKKKKKKKNPKHRHTASTDECTAGKALMKTDQNSRA